MSDDHELSPEQERVRRLLAQARVEDPMPDDVAERLDRVLARLADEEGESPATVVDLAHRRRRKAATLLVAAAAVVALGVGVGNLVPGTVSSGDDAGSAAEAPEAEAAGDADSSLRNGVDGVAPGNQFSGPASDRPQRVRPNFFADDVARLRAQQLVSITDSNGNVESQADPPPQEAPLGTASGVFVCDAAPYGAGQLVAVRYAGVPAVLAYRPPAGDTQVVDLLECGTAAILRSVTLPVP
ncbi:hypothetical protein NSZ01_29780 [Nocardioides szechwanensis]|uniref:Uncharacterized protein n=1 Tax=Nocardioides szechwanensis TaxID=1005944 RepID=A0A1H0DQ31_9ACTN|nr:hypothetical protein [Nocardioides szechwanensis]GEP35210.1 hypothetical protein NSZ01_29780 [Nocardioides szechwanensis]SDN72290.1 hypothetical protein SAMN05192576_2636 [Nocardioides szechwanensis]